MITSQSLKKSALELEAKASAVDDIDLDDIDRPDSKGVLRYIDALKMAAAHLRQASNWMTDAEFYDPANTENERTHAI